MHNWGNNSEENVWQAVFVSDWTEKKKNGLWSENPLLQSALHIQSLTITSWRVTFWIAFVAEQHWGTRPYVFNAVAVGNHIASSLHLNVEHSVIVCLLWFLLPPTEDNRKVASKLGDLMLFFKILFNNATFFRPVWKIKHKFNSKALN